MVVCGTIIAKTCLKHQGKMTHLQEDPGRKWRSLAQNEPFTIQKLRVSGKHEPLLLMTSVLTCSSHPRKITPYQSSNVPLNSSDIPKWSVKRGMELQLKNVMFLLITMIEKI